MRSTVSALRWPIGSSRGKAAPHPTAGPTPSAGGHESVAGEGWQPGRGVLEAERLSPSATEPVTDEAPEFSCYGGDSRLGEAPPEQPQCGSAIPQSSGHPREVGVPVSGVQHERRLPLAILVLL